MVYPQFQGLEEDIGLSLFFPNRHYLNLPCKISSLILPPKDFIQASQLYSKTYACFMVRIILKQIYEKEIDIFIKRLPHLCKTYTCFHLLEVD